MWFFFIIVASTARFSSRRYSDCLGYEDLGQQLNSDYRAPRPIPRSVVPARQSLPPQRDHGSASEAQHDPLDEMIGSEKNAAVGDAMTRLMACGRALSTAVLVLGLALLDGRVAVAELFDSLDAYPPRWQLDTSDCDARVIEHKNLATGGLDGGGCESVSFQAGVGSEAILIYPIEPVHPINDLVAGASVMSARSGARIGLRVRFPYFRDPQTRRPVSTTIYGATYERPGRFQTLGVGSVERELRIKIAKLRALHGADANLADPYVDAVSINAYSGPGTTTLRIDQMSVRGMIPLGDHGRVDNVPAANVSRADPTSTASRSAAENAIISQRMLKLQRPRSVQGSEGQSALDSATVGPAYPQDDVIRVLEHRGEPLAWVRSLGFDAVLLSKPPTVEILREAIQSQLLVYAPPPVAPDPAIVTLLDPVAAWYLGGGVALDNARVVQTDKTVRRLRMFPKPWQRPVVISPVESWSAYASIADALVCDTPLRSRGLPAAEQVQSLSRLRDRIGSGVELAIAVESSSAASLAAMNRSIESTIGAPPGGTFRWHAMMTQVVQSLEQSPRAIFFRSQESLVSGSTFAHQRSMALSYLNRFVAMIAPWIASARPAAPYRISGATYRCGRLQSGSHEILLLTSDQTIGDQVLAGDGRAVEIELPPEMASRTAWRLTGFSARRIKIQRGQAGARIEVVSPDVAEVIFISGDATLGARLEQSARRFAVRAASDRWQLCGDQVDQIRAGWDHAVTSGATEAIMPVDLLTAARRTLSDAESVFRAGDPETTLQLARRADAWGARAAVQLSQALLPVHAAGQVMQYVSSPPIDEGRAILQTAWQPLMQDEGWSRNLIATGGLDQPNVLEPHNWTFGQRKIARADSDAKWVSRGYFSGRGAIELSASATGGEPLGGGYEGTIAVLSSPAVSVGSEQAIRVDVMIRTIGFGGPHQGILVYDTLGGQEMGILVRGASEWTPVRLYRQSAVETDVKVMFEVIGGGVAVVDEVSVKAWTPDPLPGLPLRAINP